MKYPVCDKCFSPSIYVEALCEWNAEEGCYGVSNTTNAWTCMRCDSSGHEVSPMWVVVDSLEDAYVDKLRDAIREHGPTSNEAMLLHNLLCDLRPPKVPVCPECESIDCVATAEVSWDAKLQMWVVPIGSDAACDVEEMFCNRCNQRVDLFFAYPKPEG